MVSAFLPIVTFLIFNIFSTIINAQSVLNISINNQSNGACQVSDLDVDYSSEVNLCLGGKYYKCYWTGNNNNNNDNITFSNNNKIVNYDNILKMMNCYHVSNNCGNFNNFVMFDCVYPNASVNTNITNGCVLSQANNNNNGTVDLNCKVIFNPKLKKEYIAAFVAVIVLLIFFFCICPLCCVYYYCRYRNAKRPTYYPTNNVNNYETNRFGSGNQESNKHMKQNGGGKFGWMHATHSEKTTMKTKTEDKMTGDQEVETQPMNSSNQNDNDRNVQHEIVV